MESPCASFPSRLSAALPASPLNSARSSWALRRYFTGNLDNVRIYDHGLSAGEIANLESPGGRAGDLDLRLLQLLIADLRGQPVVGLAGECRGRQARHPRQTRLERPPDGIWPTVHRPVVPLRRAPSAYRRPDP